MKHLTNIERYRWHAKQYAMEDNPKIRMAHVKCMKALSPLCKADFKAEQKKKQTEKMQAEMNEAMKLISNLYQS